MSKDFDQLTEEEARDFLTSKFGQVWDTEQFVAEFEADSFLAPVVFVTRKADGVKGTVNFSHMPRFYFAFRKREW